MTSLRICFIGNSHTSAIKLGWEQIADRHPDLNSIFFASYRDFIRGLTVADGKLIAPNPSLRETLEWTSGGHASIDPDAYDVFVLIALGWSLTALARIFARHRTLEQDQKLKYYYLISEECFQAAGEGIFTHSVAHDILAKLRAITDKPVILLPEPFRSASILDGVEGALWRHLIAHQDGRDLMALYQRKTVQMTSDYGVPVLRQPEETLHNPFLTQTRYSVNSVRLEQNMESKHAPGENAHMNAAFGIEVWKDLIQALRA